MVGLLFYGLFIKVNLLSGITTVLRGEPFNPACPSFNTGLTHRLDMLQAKGAQIFGPLVGAIVAAIVLQVSQSIMFRQVVLVLAFTWVAAIGFVTNCRAIRWFGTYGVSLAILYLYAIAVLKL